MIKVLEALEPKTTIIVTPSSLTYNWSREIEKWSNKLASFVYSGTPTMKSKILARFRASKDRHKVLIISKDTLKREQEIQDMVFSVAIVDEAHFLRNYKSLQSKAVFKLTAKVKYALTGTPAVKHGVDVYGLLHFINPNVFSSYWQFADRYWQIDDNGWGKQIGEPKVRRVEELTTIMDLNSVQRKRKDIMKWLPAAQHENLFVKMEGKQLKLYDQMFDTFVASLGENEDMHEVDTMNKLSQLLRLRQLCLDPRLLGFDVVGAKTEALLEFAENNTDPFIVMTTFSSYFDLVLPELEKLGKRVGIIDGSISPKKKMETAAAFQNGEYDILLCNIIAAGTGFTLDRADTILFLDKDFNPANNEQAQDRIVPTTEERYHPINIISLVAGGSVDERVNEILTNKEDLTKIINKPLEFIHIPSVL
jgi:SNF2 family DNA or RNA helicase